MRVVHCKKEPYDVYIGRPGPYGNSYSHKSGTRANHLVASREEAIARFEEDMRRLPTEALRILLEPLAGKVLGCWCSPKACHGDVYIKLCREMGLIE